MLFHHFFGFKRALMDWFYNIWYLAVFDTPHGFDKGYSQM